MKFKTELKKWRRSKRFLQKQAAEFLEVNIRTYEGWETGHSVPHALSISEIKRRMAQ